MNQYVMFDKRITEHSSTRIGLVYSNDKNLNCDKLDEFQISDHIFLNNCDIDNKIKYLDDIIIEILSSITNRQRVTIKLMNKWYDSEFSNMKKMKYGLYRIPMQSGHLDEYNIIKKQYTKLIKIKTIKYIENKINFNANNSRKMWKYLKELSNIKEQKGEINTV